VGRFQVKEFHTVDTEIPEEYKGEDKIKLFFLSFVIFVKLCVLRVRLFFLLFKYRSNPSYSG